MKAAFTKIASVLLLAGSAIAEVDENVGEIQPGVFRFPVEQVRQSELHKVSSEKKRGFRLRNWADAEMWEKDAKLPVETVDNYMFITSCSIGTQTTTQVLGCIFDTSTSISSTQKGSLHAISTVQWGDSPYGASTSAQASGVTVQFDSIGLQWQGEKYTDSICLGSGDVHTTVCLDDIPFVVTASQMNSNNAQWDPPFTSYDGGNINTIIGIGFQSTNDPYNSYNFLQ